MPRLPKEEKELLDSVEAGEWSAVATKISELGRYQTYARATFKKDRRINIRISTRDLEALQKRALIEGVLPDADLQRAAQVRFRAIQRRGRIASWVLATVHEAMIEGLQLERARRFVDSCAQG